MIIQYHQRWENTATVYRISSFINIKVIVSDWPLSYYITHIISEFISVRLPLSRVNRDIYSKEYSSLSIYIYLASIRGTTVSSRIISDLFRFRFSYIYSKFWRDQEIRNIKNNKLLIRRVSIVSLLVEKEGINFDLIESIEGNENLLFL